MTRILEVCYVPGTVISTSYLLSHFCRNSERQIILLQTRKLTGQLRCSRWGGDSGGLYPVAHHPGQLCSVNTRHPTRDKPGGHISQSTNPQNCITRSRNEAGTGRTFLPWCQYFYKLLLPPLWTLALGEQFSQNRPNKEERQNRKGIW